MSSITLPGLIDPHVHLRDPGQTEKEDFFTGTCAALAGGYTTVLDMPNNKTPITTLERLMEKIKIAREKIVCDVGFYFGSTGDNLEEFKKVKHLVKGLKLYLNETTGSFLFELSKLEATFTAWSNARNPDNISILPSIRKLSNSIPILVHAEEKMVETVLGVVRKTKQQTHFCHISLASELKMITEAKNENLPITCGVTPHHLFLTEENEAYLGPYALMKPGLKKRSDVDYLWKHLQEIDCIESDHAPHTLAQKERDNPPYGVPGLETTLPLLLTSVSQDKLTIEDIIRLCSDAPADIFNIKDNNSQAEIDLTQSYLLNNKSLYTKSRWSPFDGWKMQGKVQKVTVRGKTVYENGEIIARPGSGTIIG